MPVPPSTALVGRRPPREDCRASGPPSLSLPPRAEGREGGSAPARAAGMVRSAVRWPSPVAWGGPGLSISRGDATAWLTVPRSQDQHP